MRKRNDNFSTIKTVDIGIRYEPKVVFSSREIKQKTNKFGNDDKKKNKN